MTNIENYGFTLIRERELSEIEARLFELEHTKSGARLIYLDREDENKTFSIGFPTPPENDTGVFHIIEHSVLCGSKKYPLRDPFAELLKGSLNTFLNAITYEDRTVYPVSSRCEKDFLNLVDVYMDAVFAPNLLENPNIFRQEGWHYEYDSETNSLSRSGVVYNEMKGAYSSPDEISGVALNRALWSEDIYKYDSGGNPEHIPELTYESFKAAYNKYYHPSSAKIILDGKMNIESVLALLDSHLSGFEKRESTLLPYNCKPRVAPPVTVSYEISENESENGKARLIYGFVYSDFADKEAHLAVSVLSDILCGSNASPLKKALLDRGLAKDAAMYAVKSRGQTVVIEIRDADEARLVEIEETVREVITSLAKDGIDKSRLTATLNSIEFRLRERDFGSLPTGIAFAMSIYGSWIYGGAPEDALLMEDTLASIRSKINTNYFETSLIKMTLENPHRAKVIMLPDKTLGRRIATTEKERLDATLAAMSESELQEIIKAEEELHLWQESEESDDAISSLPTLSISDIRAKPPHPEATVRNYNGAKILDCNVKTNGIVYISLYFDASDLAGEELVQLSTLSTALVNFPTEKRDALSLQNDIKANLGSLFASFAVGNRDGAATPYLKIGASALTSKSEDLVRLIGELLLTSKIENESEVKSIIMQVKANLEEGMIASGESFALSRVEASVSQVGAVNEYLASYEAYNLLCKIAADDSKISELTKDCSALLKRLVNRGRLIVSIAGDAPEGLAEKIIDIIPTSDEPIVRKTTPLCAGKDEFILLPSKVAYAVMGGRSDRVSENLGLMRVVRSILSYEYLWNTVRVKSGAYGTGFIPRWEGSIAFYSYRDPSPARSLEFYRQSSEYLRSLADSKEDITKFIIGAVGEYDIITTPRVLAAISIRNYLNGHSPKDEEKIMKDMLAVTAEDLILAADIIDEVLSNGSIAIVGGSEHLKSLEREPEKIIKI